jgi:membrane fusion protein, multidrug efflux system
MKRWMKWGLGVLTLAVVAGAGFFKLKTNREAKIQPQANVVVPFKLTANDVITTAQHELSRILQVSGGLKAVNTAVVKAKVAGEVKTLLVREGDSVKAGQMIGQLDTTELQLKLRQSEQTAASSRGQRDIAKRALENNRALVAQGFISATGLETSVSNAASAQASLEAANAAVDLARKSLNDARLVAPISGMVSQRLVQPGERVAIDAKLIEVVDLSRIEIEATVTPEDATLLKVGNIARMDIDGLAQTVPSKVARINPSTQAGTRAVTVYLNLEPHPGLRQGLYATGHIEVNRQTVLGVPLSTVRIDQSRPYVVVVENGKTTERTVVLGVRGEALINGERESVVQIKDGVAQGTPVLRGSVGKMRDGTAVELETVLAKPDPAASATR